MEDKKSPTGEGQGVYSGSEQCKDTELSPIPYIGINGEPEIKKEYGFKCLSYSEMMANGKAAKERKKIFGDFLYQGTNTLLFANTNNGKSLLAYHIGVLAATGQSFDNSEAFINECEPMRVLFFDFEMDDKMFYDRHKKAADNFDMEILNKNLKVVREDVEIKQIPGAMLLELIEQEAIIQNSELIVIDNLTKLAPDLLKADFVTAVIDTLERIRKKTGASFLVITHTTKMVRGVRINPSNYYGSAHIQNFFKEIFYIDKTKFKDKTYFLAHSKTKHAVCHEDRVPVLQLLGQSAVGVGFTLTCWNDVENIQLPLTLSDKKKAKPSDYPEAVRAMYNAGRLQSEIAKIFGCGQAAISKMLGVKS